jgi:hypothetical protein
MAWNSEGFLADGLSLTIEGDELQFQIVDRAVGLPLHLHQPFDPNGVLESSIAFPIDPEMGRILAEFVALSAWFISHPRPGEGAERQEKPQRRDPDP